MENPCFGFKTGTSFWILKRFPKTTLKRFTVFKKSAENLFKSDCVFAGILTFDVFVKKYQCVNFVHSVWTVYTNKSYFETPTVPRLPSISTHSCLGVKYLNNIISLNIYRKISKHIYHEIFRYIKRNIWTHIQGNI